MEVVVFDLDDTLVVEEESARVVFTATCQLAHVRCGVDSEELQAAARKSCRALWHAFREYPYCLSVGISSWEGVRRRVSCSRSLEGNPPSGAPNEWSAGPAAAKDCGGRIGGHLQGGRHFRRRWYWKAGRTGVRGASVAFWGALRRVRYGGEQSKIGYSTGSSDRDEGCVGESSGKRRRSGGHTGPRSANDCGTASVAHDSLIRIFRR